MGKRSPRPKGRPDALIAAGKSCREIGPITIGLKPDIMRIHAIVTTYKRPELLRRAMFAIAPQLLPSDSLTIADDDPGFSGGLSAREACIPFRSRCIRRERNLGVVANINDAIANSGADPEDWIHWCADDDWPDPGFYDAIRRAPSPAAVVHVRQRNHMPDGNTWSPPPLTIEGEMSPRATFGRFMLGNWTHMVCTAFRFRIWSDLGGFDGGLPLYHDWHFLIRSAFMYQHYYVPEVLANYSVHADSLTAKGDHNQEMVAMRELLANEFDDWLSMPRCIVG